MILRQPLITRAMGLAMAVALALAGCHKQDEAAADKKGAGGASAASVVPVILRPAPDRPVQRTVEVVGTLWGEEDVTVSNKVNGKVIAIYKDVGDRVEPG